MTTEISEAVGYFRLQANLSTNFIQLKVLCSCKNSNFSFLFQLNSNISTQSPLCQTPLLSKMYWLLKSHGCFSSFFRKLPSQIGNLSLCWGCLLFSYIFPLVIIPQISGILQRKSLTASSINNHPFKLHLLFQCIQHRTKHESCLAGCSEICYVWKSWSQVWAGKWVRLAETLLQFMAVFAITLWNVVRLPIGSKKLKSC